MSDLKTGCEALPFNTANHESELIERTAAALPPSRLPIGTASILTR